MTSISKSHLSLGGVEVDGEVAVVVVMVGLAAAVAMVVKEEKEVTINAMEDQESQPLLISGDNDGFHESNKLIQLPVLHFFPFWTMDTHLLIFNHSMNVGSNL